MQLQIIKLLMWALSLLPLRANQALGASLGRLAWALPTSARTITLTNLNLCYPDRDQAFIQHLAKNSLEETGKSLMELGYLWTRPKNSLTPLIRNVYGLEHLKAARHSQKGILFISPHLGAWEMCTVPLAQEEKVVFMYRQPRQASLDPLLRAGRTRHGAELAPLTPSGIKTVLKTLRAGHAVGILPDQEPDMANGVFAPFFNTPANTMTLLTKLADKGDAALVFIVVERLPLGRGYNLHYMPADDAIRSDNKVVAATALNRGVEECVSLFPQQYVWSYKRFRLLEDGSRRKYT